MEPKEGIICFCYRKTLADLQRALEIHGDFRSLQQATKVGLGCGGCRAMLHHHFGEVPVEINDFSADASRGATSCMKPGNRTMKGFIASSSLLESHVFSCNAVPLQLGSCDATMNVEFAIYNQQGRPVFIRRQRVSTAETFHFDTALAKLPRPFYGMATYTLERQNYGASRFNVSWYTAQSATSTHENFSTGRPDVALPVRFDEFFLNGPNAVYLAVQNPHAKSCNLTFRVFRMDDANIYGDAAHVLPAKSGWQRVIGGRRRTAVESSRRLPSMGTEWINVVEDFVIPAREILGGDAPLALRIHAPGATIHEAPSCYFFFHHRPTNIVSANHL